MKNKTSNNPAAPLKGRTVWAVIFDYYPKEYVPGYHVHTLLFADREEARKDLRQSAEEDVHFFGKWKWYGRDTDEERCEIYYGDTLRNVYLLREHTIN